MREALDLGGEIGAPSRRRLTKDEIEQILSGLAAGESSTRLGRGFGRSCDGAKGQNSG